VTGRALLIALRPRFANAIYTGLKTVELRRTRPLGGFGLVFIYETSPIGAITGYFRSAGVRRLEKDEIWKRYGESIAVTESEFDQYLEGLKFGTIIGVTAPVRFSRRISIREAVGTEDVPQSFRFLSPATASRILRAGAGSDLIRSAKQAMLQEG
jgi:predicted transcriptional regulator